MIGAVPSDKFQFSTKSSSYNLPSPICFSWFLSSVNTYVCRIFLPYSLCLFSRASSANSWRCWLASMVLSFSTKASYSSALSTPPRIPSACLVNLSLSPPSNFPFAQLRVFSWIVKETFFRFGSVSESSFACSSNIPTIPSIVVNSGSNSRSSIGFVLRSFTSSNSVCRFVRAEVRVRFSASSSFGSFLSSRFEIPSPSSRLGFSFSGSFSSFLTISMTAPIIPLFFLPLPV